MREVHVERRAPSRIVRLDTGRRNVLGLSAIEALRDAIAPDADAPVVVLRGRSDGFCAGLDGRVLAGDAGGRERLLAAMGALLRDVLHSPTRIVAVCEGHAVAAGAMLLLVSDVRLGVPGDYKVGFTEPGLGMPLPRLPARLARERLDRRRLHELTVLGHTPGPREARDAGFLDALVEPASLASEIERRATSLARLTPDAYRGSLRAVWGPALEEIDRLAAEQEARADAAN